MILCAAAHPDNVPILIWRACNRSQSTMFCPHHFGTRVSGCDKFPDNIRRSILAKVKQVNKTKINRNGAKVNRLTQHREVGRI
uniref:Uncharacterized protein n=1 Tax=Candidatus Methanogaster sp. ANME-2c ERB4 TaxID=2759911 RepID=A0A7G9YQ45_9EURY|nr:hypothetical protein DMFPCFDI_00020 [Methanosarcinales archaeon ANME-2c ERB4]QNO50129.1 hypothetical protein GDOAKEED_00033 [Methanosarcinales archaeon ANME-2c ERB4]